MFEFDFLTVMISGTTGLLTGIGAFYTYLNYRKDKSKDEFVTADTGLYEIALYWGKRDRAFDDMKKSVLEVQKEIYVSGIGVRTAFERLFLNEKVLEHFAKLTENEEDFNIHIIACDSVKSAKRHEKEYDDLIKTLTKSGEWISDFKTTLNDKIPPEIIRKRDKPHLTIKSYPDKIVPRHFILKVDEVLYVGSYLSNREGKHSYMIKLRRKNGVPSDHDGLYRLFNKEVDFLKRECIEVDYNPLKIVNKL